ncbi:MAG: Dabb family protein [Gemmatimonadetes bacterium]|nr:Dabb family protein [Gemmatimonadota bacterium]
MFVHSVYFWLRDDLSPAAKAKFVDGIRSLTTIDVVQLGFIGTPAGTNREIIDTTYSYALVLTFADAAAQDAYQVHPVHDAFRENCGGSWKKIVIYDAVSA